MDAARVSRYRGLTADSLRSHPPFVARRPGVCHDAGAVPTYDYQCRSCGTVTEVIHAMTADGPTVCERCGGDLRRVLYPAGIIFKGSGFYRTDSRAAGSGDGAPSKPATTKPSSGGADAAASSGSTGSGTTSTGSGSSGSSSGGESAA